MPLPILETPNYELMLPSTGKKIKYRPFLVKEYKILLTTMEAGKARAQAAETARADRKAHEDDVLREKQNSFILANLNLIIWWKFHGIKI